MDDDWMSQLETMAKNSKRPGGNKHLLKVYSFPAELLRDGASIKWRPFTFKIHEIGSKRSRSMTIVEEGTNEAKPVEVRLGTQPMFVVQNNNLGDVVLHCEEYTVTEYEGRPQLFLWRMETSKMIKDGEIKRKRWARQVTLPVIRVKRKKKKKS